MSDKFGKATTGEQVTELFAAECKGMTVVITGGNVGLGLETGRCLAKHGAHVVLCSRSVANGQAAVEKIKKEQPDAVVSYMQLDLASLKTVRDFAAEFQKFHKTLNILINNAGIMACPKSLTSDGFESQFGVNHLAHFYLTTLLMPMLLKSATKESPSRVVNLSSIAHLLATPAGINFDDLQGDSYNPWERYSMSKLSNLLFTNELHRRYDSQNVTCVSVHPGMIAGTNLAKSVSAYAYMQFMWALISAGSGGFMFLKERFKSIPEGVSTTLVAALDPKIIHGAYYYDCAFNDGKKVHARYADAEVGAKLWDVSEKLINEAVAKIQ